MTSPRVRRVQAGRQRAWILPDVTAPAAALAATLLALILVGTVVGTVLRRAGLTGLVDQPTETFLVTHRTAWLTDAMRLVTDLGAAAVLVPLILVAGLGWRWRRGSWRPLALLGGAAAGAWAVQVAVKQLVERPRPPAGLALSHATGFAFPSGHATDAAAVYGMLAVLLARSGRRAASAAALLAAVGVIALVGLSRLYLGVHWLTDVVGGVGIGAVWLVSLILFVGTRIELPTRPGSKRTARFRQRIPGQSGIVRCQAMPADGLVPFLAGGTGRPIRLRWLGWALAAVLLMASLVVPELAEGTDVAAKAAVAVSRPPQPTDVIPRAAAVRPISATAHVVLVVEENHEFGQVIGSRQAPFLNRLAARGTLLTRYYAVTHPSLPNYIALVAGDPLGIHSDCRSCHRRGRTLIDQLEAAGISWKAYYQAMPAPCSSTVTAGAYVKKVNPFLHLDSVRSSPRRCRRVVPLSQLNADLGRGRLPRFALVTPDLAHSMHSGSIRQADTFLQHLHHRLRSSSVRRSGILLIVTFDEGKSDRGLHGRRGGGHVATILVGRGVPAGVRDPTPYSHYALLRSLERRFGLHPLRHAADRETRTIPAIAGPSPAQPARRSR
jgi:membrane-associated phospholipid phosphatase